MKLEVGTFPVQAVRFGKATRWHDSVLEIDRDELLGLAIQDPIKSARVELASPGDSVRIINYEDVLEPKVKVSGGGTTYPGVCGRATDEVGSGRTHRLGGLGVVECLDPTKSQSGTIAEARMWGRSSRSKVNSHFIDMSGRKTAVSAVTPYAGLHNVCVVVDAPANLNFQEQSAVTAAAAHRVADRLAGAIRDLNPPEIEIFDMEPKPELPGMVYIPHLASAEPQTSARGTYGTAVYGQTRLSAPWLLSPTEMLDGAVSGAGSGWGGASWVLANSPIVLDLCRRHGKQLNFLGCIIQRTNWTNQSEYTLAAHKAARIALAIGAQGAIITTDVRGQRWVGTMLTLQACEQLGIKTVLLTEEEDNENGSAPPLLFAPPELVAAVSDGTGDVPEPYPPVSKVIGTVDPAPKEWLGELPAVHGAYGGPNVFRDFWGFGTESYADF